MPDTVPPVGEAKLITGASVSVLVSLGDVLLMEIAILPETPWLPAASKAFALNI